MSNICENCINPYCMECPVMGREVFRELGIDLCDSYDGEDEDEDEEVTPPHYNSVLRLMTAI